MKISLKTGELAFVKAVLVEPVPAVLNGGVLTVAALRADGGGGVLTFAKVRGADRSGFVSLVEDHLEINDDHAPDATPTALLDATGSWSPVPPEVLAAAAHAGPRDTALGDVLVDGEAVYSSDGVVSHRRSCVNPRSDSWAIGAEEIAALAACGGGVEMTEDGPLLFRSGQVMFQPQTTADDFPQVARLFEPTGGGTVTVATDVITASIASLAAELDTMAATDQDPYLRLTVDPKTGRVALGAAGDRAGRPVTLDARADVPERVRVSLDRELLVMALANIGAPTVTLALPQGESRRVVVASGGTAVAFASRIDVAARRRRRHKSAA